MAVSVTSQTSPYVDNLIVDTNCNKTSEAAVFSGASANVYIVDIDNTNNANTIHYVKLFNANVSGDVGGSNAPTEPDVILMVPAGKRQAVTVQDGVLFGSDFSFACVTLSATAGNTSPVNNITVRIMAE